MYLQILLSVAVVENIATLCDAVDGVIWSRPRQDFVGIFTVPGFARLRRDLLDESRRLESYDFQRQVVTVAYYEEKNMVEFYDDDTRVGGICGEIWNLLADYANFTLMPINSADRSFGVLLENGSHTGLLGLIERKEAQIILRTGFYINRLNMISYAMPIWKSSYRLYIQPKWKRDNTWVITRFSRACWYTISFSFVSLSVIGYFLERLQGQETRTKKRRKLFNLSDHIFYTFAMMCTQGFVPTDFYTNSKILNLTKSVFAWLLLIAYSSNLIYRMAYREQIPPFNDVASLMNDTNYTLLAFEGSMVYEKFKRHVYSLSDKATIDSRVEFTKSRQTMFTEACKASNVALFQNEDKYLTFRRFQCQLVPVGRAYFPTWISAAMAKDFKYKRTVDNGILKLHEVGLVDELKNRFLGTKMAKPNLNTFKTVNFYQVGLIFMMLLVGTFISVLVLVLENVIFLCDNV